MSTHINSTKDKVFFRLEGLHLSQVVNDAIVDCINLFHGQDKVDDKQSIQTVQPVEYEAIDGFYLNMINSIELHCSNIHEILQSTLDYYLSRGDGKFLLLESIKQDAKPYLAFMSEVPMRRAQRINMRIGVLLLLLVQRKVITLPVEFNWPMTMRNDYIQENMLESELLKLLRGASWFNMATQSGQNPSYSVISQNKNYRIDMLSKVAKMLAALGWTSCEEMNFEELELLVKERMRRHNDKLDAFTPYMRSFIKICQKEYGEKLQFDVIKFDEFTNQRMVALKKVETYSSVSDVEVWKIDPFLVKTEDVALEVLKGISRVSGISKDIKEAINCWASIQSYYVELCSKRMLELKNINSALGYLNIYIFVYLVKWFKDNPKSCLEFPSSPSKFNASDFISRVNPRPQDSPLRFSEFMEIMAQKINHKGKPRLTPPSLRSHLDSLSQFFNYLESALSDRDDCKGFKNGLSRFDFPRSYRTMTTNKRPIPRAIFSIYIKYVDALIKYYEVLIKKTIEYHHGTGNPIYYRGGVKIEFMDLFCQNIGPGGFYEASKVAHLVDGYLPSMSYKGKEYQLELIPDVFDSPSGSRYIVNGRGVRLPRPHALINIATALYTGLRNQHIQWLDRDTYDQKADRNAAYSSLYVNTDKVKKRGWYATVDSRVISILDLQKSWRSLVNAQGFNRKISYSDNDNNTSYEQFLPLFSHKETGQPHPDSSYANAWLQILCGMEIFLSKVDDFNSNKGGAKKFEPLFKFLPDGITAEDDEKDPGLKFRLHSNISQRKESSQVGVHSAPYTPVRAKSSIVPHSARVTVVTGHILNALPPDIIGKHITGHRGAALHTYVKMDAQDIAALVSEQKENNEIRIAGSHAISLSEDFTELADGKHPSRFIKADSPHSGFVSALESGYMEHALDAYGCVSVSLSDIPKNGIDILREINISNIAYNKTEICPFGNVCPKEIVQSLKGVNRCGLCPYAVRHIDHLPAICAKQRQLIERLENIESILTSSDLAEKYTQSEIDGINVQRSQIAEEALGYQIAAEVLEQRRADLSTTQTERVWHVREPQILREKLMRVHSTSFAENEIGYLIERLAEISAYPSLASSEVTAKYIHLQQLLLAGQEEMRDRFLGLSALDPIKSCLTQIKLMIDVNGIDINSLPKAIGEMRKPLLLTDQTTSVQ